MWNYYGGHMLGWGIFGGFLMIVLMIAFWVAILFLVVWIVREISGRNSRSGLKALETLKERYAKGEIDRKEFEEKKKDLIS